LGDARLSRILDCRHALRIAVYMQLS
jgi:hypothetical protein